MQWWSLAVALIGATLAVGCLSEEGRGLSMDPDGVLGGDASGDSWDPGDSADPGDTGGTGEGGEGCTTFEESVQPILTASCAFAGCHGGGSPAQGLLLESGSAIASLVGVDSSEQPGTPLVDPGSLDTSFLWIKLLPDPPVGARMPYGGALSGAQLDAVAAWIEAGAPEGEYCTGSVTPGGGVDQVEVVAPAATVAVGELLPLTVEVTDADGAVLATEIVTWRSLDEAKAYVDRDGTVLGVEAGAAEIQATAGGVDSAPVTVTVTAADPPGAAFSGDVLPKLQASCALAGCHVDNTEAGDLKLDDTADDVWEDLMDEAEEVPSLARIAPNQPNASWLFLKLARTSPQFGAQMPLGGAPWPAEDVQTVLRWILDGAPYN
jgi:hypothetical protein